MTTYQEKLKDPRWQKKRLGILERDEHQCKGCGEIDIRLHVHHKTYLPSREPWDYPSELLVSLCECCHNDEDETRPVCEKRLIHELRQRFLYKDLLNIIHAVKNGELDDKRNIYIKESFTDE